MERMADFFGAPAARNVTTPRNLNDGPTESPTVGQINQAPEIQTQPRRVQIPAQVEPETVPILVNWHQDADQVVAQARQNNYEGQNNIANIVEALLAQNGFNMGLHRPNFVSALSKPYSDSADTKFGLCSPILKPFWANKASTILAILFWPS